MSREAATPNAECPRSRGALGAFRIRHSPWRAGWNDSSRNQWPPNSHTPPAATSHSGCRREFKRGHEPLDYARGVVSDVVASFVYHDEHGTPVVRIDRLEPGFDGGSKAFLPYVADGCGGFAEKAGLGGAKLPLYRVDEVRAAIEAGEAIWLVEGEGKGDRLRGALRSAGRADAVTTIAGGAQAKLTAEHLAELCDAQDVIVVADSDVPGRRAMHKRAQAIAEKHPTCVVRSLDLYPNRTDGCDVADFLDEGGTVCELLERVRKAPSFEPSFAEPASIEWSDPRPWPVLDDAALHGLVGEFVRTVAPHSEADPVALLVNFIVAFAAMVGPLPYYVVESTRHYALLFALIVGKTSTARKGTARGRVRHLFKIADEETLQRIQVSGLSTGEGLVEHLALRDAENGEKRTLVIAEEFVRVLKVAERDGNTLSETLRRAWDGDTLQILTRKKSALKIEGTHVNLVGDITLAELNAQMPALEIANGLLNRIPLFCAKRSNVLPHGGALCDGDLAAIAKKLRAAIEHARTLGRVEMTERARKEWEVWYRQVPEADDLLGAATARAEAQALRFSLLFALISGADSIDVPHLRAAFALWRYSYESAQHILGDRLGDPVADKLLRSLREAYPYGLTGREIDDLFGKSLRPGKLDTTRNELERRHLIRSESEPSGGRPTVRWFAVPPPDKADKGGQTAETGLSPVVCPVNPVCPGHEMNGVAPPPTDSNADDDRVEVDKYLDADALFVYANERIRSVEPVAAPIQESLDL